MAKEQKSCPRLGKVGGQAVIEGIMMKAGENCPTAVRLSNGSIAVYENTFVSVRKKHKVLNLPLLRGIVNFVESMRLSFQTLTISAEAMGVEEEETRFEKWLKSKFGVNIYNVITVIAAVLGVFLAVGIFMYLPRLAADGLSRLLHTDFGVWSAAIEGGMKVVIFILYLLLVSLMKDIRRTFEYHGAEHKSIACFEAGEELTPENAKKHTRFHPRCGTSFMFFMILLGVLLGFGLRFVLPDWFIANRWLYTAVRLLLLPLVVGLGYEFIMLAGKHLNFVTRLLSAPGLWMQRITTREPDEKQLEVAIVALKYALVEDFPDFDRTAYAPPKQKEDEKKIDGEDGNAAV